MITSEAEYQDAVRQLDEQRQRLSDQQAKLEGMGLQGDETKRAIDPMRSFHQQLAEDVATYERLKDGELD